MKKICILTHFSIYPPVYGGQLRVYHLAEKLSAYFHVTVLSVSNILHKKYILNVNSQFSIINNPQLLLSLPVGATFVTRLFITEATFPFWLNMSPSLIRGVKDCAAESDIVICENSYIYPFIDKLLTGREIIYDSENVDYLLKRDLSSNNIINKKFILPNILAAERYACQKSKVVFATCREDKENFIELYNISPGKIHIVPNGVDTDEIKPCNAKDRSIARKQLGINTSGIVSFIGSAHPPNIEAVEFIISNIAPILSNYAFVIFGSVVERINFQHPSNVVLMKSTTKDMKDVVLKATDIALNPMFHGSGTNLKVLEYLAAGLPIISTPIGVRGLDVDEQNHVILSPHNDFAEEIVRLFNDDQMRRNLSYQGRLLAEKQYNWKVIAANLADYLNAAHR